MPVDDVACGPLACPADTPCRQYTNQTAMARCQAVGQCKTQATCVATNAALGTSCASGLVCDGLGGCSLSVNGATCATGATCQSGACVQGHCGVLTCQQLGKSALGPIEVSGLLESSAPSGNPVGGAILLSGTLSTVTHLCFDGGELSQLYNDQWNVMFQMPQTAVGAHTVRAITSDGKVSAPFSIQVTGAYSGTRTMKFAGGGMTLPIVNPPPTIYTPAYKVAIDPITNVWNDAFDPTPPGTAGGIQWTIGGTPWVAGSGCNGVNCFISANGGGEYARITSQYDVPHHRARFTVAPDGCTTGPPCMAWDYIAIFSCWRPSNPMSCGFDPCHDVPNMTTEQTFWTSSYHREIVLFPVGAADPQGVLRVGGCPGD
jgi:hypothetical protein